jgi:hypothetical protein
MIKKPRPDLGCSAIGRKEKLITLLTKKSFLRKINSKYYVAHVRRPCRPHKDPWPISIVTLLCDMTRHVTSRLFNHYVVCNKLIYILWRWRPSDLDNGNNIDLRTSETSAYLKETIWRLSSSYSPLWEPDVSICWVSNGQWPHLFALWTLDSLFHKFVLGK